MNLDTLFDLMVKAQKAIDACGGTPCMRMNPTATAWALEMERRGLLKRLENGMFDSARMFELWKENGNSYEVTMATLGGNVPTLKQPGEFDKNPPNDWCVCGHAEGDHGLNEEDGGPSPNCQAVVGDGTCPCKAYDWKPR